MLETNALASALGQEDVALEVVVVDDGSRDGTTARLRALDEPRLVLVRHDERAAGELRHHAGIDNLVAEPLLAPDKQRARNLFAIPWLLQVRPSRGVPRGPPAVP